MRIAALAVTCICIAACATASRLTDHDRTCAALQELATTPSTTMWPDLQTRDDDRRLDAISTVGAPQGGYVCSERTYHETGRGRAVFFDVGISSDKRYASVGMGSSTFGQRCLLRNTGEGWSLVGCRILWIA